MRSTRLLVIVGVVAAALAPGLPAGATVTTVTGATPTRVDAPTTPWTTLDLTGAGLAAGDIVTSVPATWRSLGGTFATALTALTGQVR